MIKWYHQGYLHRVYKIDKSAYSNKIGVKTY